jgi:adenylate kinase
MKLVLTGIQWCGKGTQARLLVEKYGFVLLEMGWEFRRVIASGGELGKKIQEQYDRGDQISPDLWVAVMKDAVKNVVENYGEKSIIFDAFIRNDWNKHIFDEFLPDYQVVLFQLSEEKAKKRLLGRMFNPISGETFMSEVTHDPKTGEKLIQRADDNEAGILKRIDLYREVTLPIVELQRKEGKVIEIDADQSVDAVFKELETKLNLT